MSGHYVLPAAPRAPYCGPEGLWTRREAALLGVAVGLGAVGLTVGWRGSAGEANWRDNASWIVLGTASVALAAVGFLGWIVVGRVRVLRSRGAVTRVLARRLEAKTPAAPSPVPDTFVTVPGMRRRHRPSCLLLRGKTLVPADARVGDLRPCGVCES